MFSHIKQLASFQKVPTKFPCWKFYHLRGGTKKISTSFIVCIIFSKFSVISYKNEWYLHHYGINFKVGYCFVVEDNAIAKHTKCAYQLTKF